MRINQLTDLIVPIIGKINKLIYYGKNYLCPLCQCNLRLFSPLPDRFKVTINIHNVKYSYNDFETLNGSKYLCPVCRCSDRDRMCALYLKYRTDVSDNKQQMIHFAPERSLSKFIIREDKFVYLTADLYMSQVDLKLDIAHMSVCEDAQFDCFLCSHVLEHVLDDTKAMKELYRILKPGGWGVVMSPIIPSLEMTYEDFSLTTPKERLRHFGQKDHVRVYAKNDFIKRLENTGFHVNELSHEFFGGETFRRSGISSDSVLYVVEKPA